MVASNSSGLPPTAKRGTVLFQSTFPSLVNRPSSESGRAVFDIKSLRRKGSRPTEPMTLGTEFTPATLRPIANTVNAQAFSDIEANRIISVPPEEQLPSQR